MMRRVVLSITVLAALAIVGTILAKTGADSDSNAADAAPRAAQPRPDRSELTADLVAPPAGEVSSLEEARRAAAVAVALTDEVVRAGFISRRDLIGTFATSRFAGELADRTSSQVSALLADLGERDADTARISVVEQPVTATVVSRDGPVRVSVWSVTLIAVPGAGVGRQVWHTVTLDMVRTDGRWLVDGWESALGPTPAPAAEASFEDATVVQVPMGWQSASELLGVG